MDTLKRLLGSRKFLAALGAAVVAAGVILWGWQEEPAAEIAGKIVEAVVWLAGLFVVATAAEDAAQKFGQGDDFDRNRPPNAGSG